MVLKGLDENKQHPIPFPYFYKHEKDTTKPFQQLVDRVAWNQFQIACSPKKKDEEFKSKKIVAIEKFLECEEDNLGESVTQFQEMTTVEKVIFLQKKLKTKFLENVKTTDTGFLYEVNSQLIENEMKLQSVLIECFETAFRDEKFDEASKILNKMQYSSVTELCILKLGLTFLEAGKWKDGFALFKKIESPIKETPEPGILISGNFEEFYLIAKSLPSVNLRNYLLVELFNTIQNSKESKLKEKEEKKEKVNGESLQFQILSEIENKKTKKQGVEVLLGEIFDSQRKDNEEFFEQAIKLIEQLPEESYKIEKIEQLIPILYESLSEDINLFCEKACQAINLIQKDEDSKQRLVSQLLERIYKDQGQEAENLFANAWKALQLLPKNPNSFYQDLLVHLYELLSNEPDSLATKVCEILNLCKDPSFRYKEILQIHPFLKEAFQDDCDALAKHMLSTFSLISSSKWGKDHQSKPLATLKTERELLIKTLYEKQNGQPIALTQNLIAIILGMEDAKMQKKNAEDLFKYLCKFYDGEPFNPTENSMTKLLRKKPSSEEILKNASLNNEPLKTEDFCAQALKIVESLLRVKSSDSDRYLTDLINLVYKQEEEIDVLVGNLKKVVESIENKILQSKLYGQLALHFYGGTQNYNEAKDILALASDEKIKNNFSEKLRSLSGNSLKSSQILSS